MIELLDNLLRTVIAQAGIGLTGGAIGFRAPDRDWRTSVTTDSLNIYLVDLRENLSLRSNQRVLRASNGTVEYERAPRRLDCHYLITAWSPAQEPPTIEATLDEHAILSDVAAVLFNTPLVPSSVYSTDPAAEDSWRPFQDMELPTVVTPAEGFAKLGEFWSSMPGQNPWKPAIYLIVTVPIALQSRVAGPMVTTRITEYRQTGRPDSAEIWIQIGGRVLAHTNGASSDRIPVAQAWVGLETAAGDLVQHIESDEDGRFVFGDLRPGYYTLRARTSGSGESQRLISVPSPDGDYNLDLEQN